MTLPFLACFSILMLGAGIQPEAQAPKTFVGELWGSEGGNKIAFYRVFDGSKVLNIESTPDTSISFTARRESIGIGSRIRVEIAADPVDPVQPGVLIASRIEYLTSPAESILGVKTALNRLMEYFTQPDPDALMKTPDHFGAPSHNEAVLSLLIDLHSRRLPKSRLPPRGFGGWAIASRHRSQVEVIHSGEGFWRSSRALRVVLDCSRNQARIAEISTADSNDYGRLIFEPSVVSGRGKNAQ